MHSLSNDYIEIKVALKGAELKSIYNRQSRLEYMWQAGPEWPKSSPVLFPIVGELKNNGYTYNGRQYSLSRHGFARDMEFSLVAQDTNSLTFLLKETDETLAKYPFHFSFYTRYTLHENKVQVSFIINNTGDAEMHFSVGAHPAFAVPLVEGTSYNDYFLEFQKEENADRWPIVEGGLIDSNPVPFLSNTNVLQLNKSLFAKDAIVLKDLASKEISLKNKLNNHGLTVRFAGFPYMGIWAAPGADFVCIEPWCGIADGINATGDLTQKEGMILLPKGESVERSYSIKVF